MTEQRFTLTTSANGKIKYINDLQMELSDRHGQIMGFIVEDDHEENVELLIEFLNKNCQYEQLLTNHFTWDNPIMYDKENGRCRCIPIPYKKREVKND